MAPIATYVFFDLETTGLPSEEFNRTKITELSMVAVKREHVLATAAGGVPRVQHKLTRCFQPARRISDASAAVTGLDNFLLEHESTFDLTSFEIINGFLNTLTKPVCLVSHNGRNFDFPILRRQLEMLNRNLSEDTMCADTLYGFYDILEAKKLNIQATELTTNIDLVDQADLSADNTLSMKSVNETTPKQVKVNLKRPHADNVKRRLPWSKGRESYTLAQVYERVLRRPASGAHRAETDCLLSLEIAVVLSKEFVSWVDNNHCPLADIPPMTVGIKIDN